VLGATTPAGAAAATRALVAGLTVCARLPDESVRPPPEPLDEGCDTPDPPPELVDPPPPPPPDELDELDELVEPPPPPDPPLPPPELEDPPPLPLDVRGMAWAAATTGTASPRAATSDAAWRIDFLMAATPEVRADLPESYKCKFTASGRPPQ